MSRFDIAASLAAHLSRSWSESWGTAFAVIAIVAGVALLLGLIGEYPDSRVWKKTCWYRAAKLAVILGVLFELIGDAGVFETTARLECFQAQDFTRHLSSLQQSSISTDLRRFDNIVANIWVFSGGRLEKTEFASSLAEVLRDANWTTNGVSTRIMPDMGMPYPAQPVIVRWRDGQKAKGAASALIDELSKVCIPAADGGSFTDNSNFGEPIIIGPAPTPSQDSQIAKVGGIFGPSPLPNADISILVGNIF